LFGSVFSFAAVPVQDRLRVLPHFPPGAFPNIFPVYIIHDSVGNAVEVSTGAGVKDPFTGVVQPTHGTKKTSQTIDVIFELLIRVTLGFGTVKAGSSAAYCAIQ